MSDKAYVEVSREIFDGGDGASVVVAPWDSEMVGIKVARNQVSIEWFGDKEMSFSPKVARAVAEAMIKCADEVDPTVQP